MLCVIGYLCGVVHGSCVLTDSGVGYLVHTPHPLGEGERVELVVETVVRENSITLYGFAGEADRDLFGALTKVSGVGPSLALSLLAQLGGAGVRRAIVQGDERALTAAKGVGPRVARAILAAVHLEDAVEDEVDPEGWRDVASTLEALGWSATEARDAVRAAAAAGIEDETERVRWSLAHLRGGAS